MMERTRGMSLSSEEKEKIRQEDFRKRAKGFRIRLLDNPSDADEILSSLSAEAPEDKPSLACLDFKGYSPAQRFIERINARLELPDALPIMTDPSVEIETSPKADAHRFHGTVSHEAIIGFFSDKLPLSIEKDSPDTDDEQIFSKGSQKALGNREELFAVHEVTPQNNRTKNCQPPEGKISGFDLNRIKILWHHLMDDIAAKKHWQGWARFHELESLLWPYFSKSIAKLRSYHSQPTASDQHLILLSLMSWASAIIWGYQTKRRPLFHELSVMDPTYGLSGGRMDVLDIITIDGETPKTSQSALLYAMSRQRYRSAGHLLRKLFVNFRHDIELRVVEFKFAIGDATSREGFIQPEDVANGPINQHLKQLLRYLTLAEWDLQFVNAQHGEKTKKPYFNQARIVYFFPNLPPLVFDVSINEKDREQVLFKQFAGPWASAEERAGRRKMFNSLIGSVIHTLNQNGKLPEVRLGTTNDQLLFPDKKPSIREVIASARRFVDEPTRIIEVKGFDKKDEPRFRMHLDRLLKAIQDGSVRTGQFDLALGGKIECPWGHVDKTPSLHVYLSGSHFLHFHCFSCGRRGSILHSSIPEELNITIDTSKARRRRKLRHVPEPEVSKQHALIMATAQELLQAEFKRSPAGKNYLERVRGIDPDFAFQKGIGFANSSLVKGLLENEFTFEELVHYGFLGFSRKVKPSWGICPLLLDAGYDIESLTRTDIDRQTHEQITLLPYFKLNNRITAPLTHPDGIITSFYGRSINPEAGNKHHKLSDAFTCVPHGAYNMQVINDSPWVIVVEGIMDKLSLELMGASYVIAVIGVKNFYILKRLAQSKLKTIYIALDNDQSGRKNSASTFKNLKKELGYMGKMVNFTASFLKHYPDCRQYDDLNKILQEKGRLSLEGII